MWDEQEINEALINHEITQILVDAEHQRIVRLKLDDEQVIYLEAWGDCCSTSWFAQIRDTRSFVIRSSTDLITYPYTVVSPNRVQQVLDFSDYLGRPDDNISREECDIVYAFVIVFTQGRVYITYRNSSNGYYGGGVQLLKTLEVEPTWESVESRNWVAPEFRNKIK